MREAGTGQHHRTACEAHRDGDPRARDLPEPQGELGSWPGSGRKRASLAAPPRLSLPPAPGSGPVEQGLAEAAVSARGGRAGQGQAGSLTPLSRASWAPGRWEAGGRAAPGGGAEAAAALARLRSRCGTFRRRPGFLAFSVPVRENGNRETSEMALLPTACGGWGRGRRAASG